VWRATTGQPQRGAGANAAAVRRRGSPTRNPDPLPRSQAHRQTDLAPIPTPSSLKSALSDRCGRQTRVRRRRLGLDELTPQAAGDARRPHAAHATRIATLPPGVLLGPWRWMLLIHPVADDRVVIVTIQDARAAAAPTAER